MNEQEQLCSQAVVEYIAEALKSKAIQVNGRYIALESYEPKVEPDKSKQFINAILPEEWYEAECFKQDVKLRDKTRGYGARMQKRYWLVQKGWKAMTAAQRQWAVGPLKPKYDLMYRDGFDENLISPEWHSRYSSGYYPEPKGDILCASYEDVWRVLNLQKAARAEARRWRHIYKELLAVAEPPEPQEIEPAVKPKAVDYEALLRCGWSGSKRLMRQASRRRAKLKAKRDAKYIFCGGAQPRGLAMEVV